MKNTIIINGELAEALLSGATVQEHYNVKRDWFVLAKVGYTFCQYETDNNLEFKLTRTWLLNRPSAVKMFRADIKDRVPLLQVVDPAAAWRPGMTKGEWQAIEENNRKLLEDMNKETT